MKNMSVKSVCAVALSIASFVGFAGAPIAIWESFNGLSKESPLEPSYSSVYNQIDGSIWRFNLGGGSVQDGVLCTGTGLAPYISFGSEKSLDLGYDQNVITVLMEIEVPVASVLGAPFVHIGNGEQGIGLAYKSSNQVCGTWDNSPWNIESSYKEFELLGSEEKRNVYLAVSPRSAGLSVAVVDSNSLPYQWTVVNSGLKSRELSLNQINFGNFVGTEDGGLSYKIKRVGVFSGDNLAMSIGVMDKSFDLVTEDKIVDDGSSELGSIFILPGVTVTVNDSTKITGNTVVRGYGTIVYNGFVPQNTVHLSDRASWKGTAGLNCAFGDNHDFSKYGNANSVIHFMSDATANYLAENKTIASDFILDGIISHNNGWSSNGGQTFSGKVTGSGSFITTGTPTDVIKFTGDMSEFAGAITVNGGHCVAIGTQDDNDSACGKIVITTVANIAKDKEWSAQEGVLVRASGTIGGSGCVNSSLKLEDGATISRVNGVLSALGDVIFPSRFNVTLPEGLLPTGDSGTMILKKTLQISDGEEVVVRDVRIFVNGNNDYYLVKKSDGYYAKAKTVVERNEVTVSATNSKISDVMDTVVDKVLNLVIDFSENDLTFTFDNSAILNSVIITNSSDEATVGSIILAPNVTLSYTSLNLCGVTLSADAAFFAANSGLISGDGRLALASGEYTLEGANTYSGGTDIAEGATLTANANSLGTGPISGAGVLKVNGYPQNDTVRNSLSNAENWTGRFVCMGNVTAQDNSDWLGASGNENSQIEFTGVVSGYFKQKGVCNADLIVTGSITNNNGWSNDGGYTFNGDLLGTGSFVALNDGVNDVLKFLGETKDFAGAISVEGRRCVSFGDTQDQNLFEGNLVVQTNCTANVSEGKTWSAVNGVVVFGKIGGAGSISSALTLKSGAVLDVSSGQTLTVNGALNIEGRINVILPSDVSLIGTPIIKYSADNPHVAIGNLKVGGYKLSTETVDGIVIVKIASRTGFNIIVR